MDNEILNGRVILFIKSRNGDERLVYYLDNFGKVFSKKLEFIEYRKGLISLILEYLDINYVAKCNPEWINGIDELWKN